MHVFNSYYNICALTILPALSIQMKVVKASKSVKLRPTNLVETLEFCSETGGYRSKAAIEFVKLLDEFVPNSQKTVFRTNVFKL